MVRILKKYKFFEIVDNNVSLIANSNNEFCKKLNISKKKLYDMLDSAKNKNRIRSFQDYLDIYNGIKKVKVKKFKIDNHTYMKIGSYDITHNYPEFVKVIYSKKNNIEKFEKLGNFSDEDFAKHINVSYKKLMKILHDLKYRQISDNDWNEIYRQLSTEKIDFKYKWINTLKRCIPISIKNNRVLFVRKGNKSKFVVLNQKYVQQFGSIKELSKRFDISPSEIQKRIDAFIEDITKNFGKKYEIFIKNTCQKTFPNYEIVQNNNSNMSDITFKNRNNEFQVEVKLDQYTPFYHVKLFLDNNKFQTHSSIEQFINSNVGSIQYLNIFKCFKFIEFLFNKYKIKADINKLKISQLNKLFKSIHNDKKFKYKKEFEEINNEAHQTYNSYEDAKTIISFVKSFDFEKSENFDNLVQLDNYKVDQQLIEPITKSKKNINGAINSVENWYKDKNVAYFQIGGANAFACQLTNYDPLHLGLKQIKNIVQSYSFAIYVNYTRDDAYIMPKLFFQYKEKDIDYKFNFEQTMKHTRKQIKEAIQHWTKILESMQCKINENDMQDNAIMQKINEFDFKKYNIEKTQLNIKIIHDTVKWLNDGGDGFGEEDNPNAKCGKYLTNQDMGVLLEYINHSLDSKSFTHAVVNAIKEYGMTGQHTLYRGLSMLEYRRIFKHISQGKTTFSISEAKSTSLSKDVANNFATNAYHGGSKNGGKLITIKTDKNALDYTNFLICMYVGYYLAEIMTEEELEEQMSYMTPENSEQEVILAPSTMELIDKKNLIFKVK